MNVQVLSASATLPSPFMGYHLCAAGDVVVPAHGEALVKTDLKIVLPEGVLARMVILPYREDMMQLSVGACQDREENVSFKVRQQGNEDFIIKAGDVVAQLILERSP